MGVDGVNQAALVEALAFLHSWLAYRAHTEDICGFTVAIHHDEEIVFSAAYGRANLATDEVMTPGHMLGAGSQSKMVASTAVCQLVGSGLLGFEDRVCAHIPWLSAHSDPRFQDITVRQVLSHTAGVTREGADASHWQLEKPFPDERALARMVLASDLAVESNTRPKYSNLAFGIVGQLVRAASGRPYVDYVTEHVLQPAGMESTVADLAPEVVPRLSASYAGRIEGTRRRIDCQVATRALAPATGLFTTAEDMCRFAAGHYWSDQALIGSALRKEAHRSQWVLTTGYDAGAEMGLGFQIMTVGDRRLVGHTGSFGGYQSATFFEPQGALAVSVMANFRDAPVAKMIRGVFEALHHFARYTNDSGAFARYNVRLRSTLATVEIVATGDRIVAVNPDDWEPFTFAEELALVDPATLRVVTPGSLFHEGELARYAFDDAGVRSVNYGGFIMRPDRGGNPPAIRVRSAQPMPQGRHADATVSVIMPVGRICPWLGNAVESVVAQTYGDWQLVLVDDGTTDNTLAVARSWADRDSRITLVPTDHAKVNQAPNVGLDHVCASDRAAPDFVAFLDGNDMWRPEFLATTLLRLAGLDNSFIGVYCNSTTVDAHGEPVFSNLDNIDSVFGPREGSLGAHNFDEMMTSAFSPDVMGTLLFRGAAFRSVCDSILHLPGQTLPRCAHAFFPRGRRSLGFPTTCSSSGTAPSKLATIVLAGGGT